MEREQRKFLVGQVRAEREEGASPRIVGYAAVFNQNTDLGMWTESIAPGAFTDSLKRGDDVRALIDHHPDKIIGRTPKTLALREDDHGLHYTVNPPDTLIVRDLITNIDAGLITQSSFGFFIEGEELDRTGEKPHFTITRAKLFDVSPVTFPAYKGTDVQVARSLDEQTEELKERLARFGCPDLALHQRAIRQRAIELFRLLA